MCANMEQNPKFILIKKKWDGPTDYPTDGWTEQGVESRSTQLKQGRIHGYPSRVRVGMAGAVFKVTRAFGQEQ